MTILILSFFGKDLGLENNINIFTDTLQAKPFESQQSNDKLSFEIDPGMKIRENKFEIISNDSIKKIYESGRSSTDKKNYVKIESQNIYGDIGEGPKEKEQSILKDGFWRYPETGFPSFDNFYNNTPIIFGHRRLVLPPEQETFYNLDKVKVGDIIEVGYDNKIYKYEIIDTKIVPDSDWKAIQPETFRSIKLVTCTPLGKDTHRIVVTGKML